MPEYLSPRVYVEEVPSAVRPIAGVGTTTAAFIGIVPDTIQVPTPNQDYDPTRPQSSEQPTPAPVEGQEPTSARKRGRQSETGQSLPYVPTDFVLKAPPNEPRLCTNFTEFTDYFGDFSTDPGHRDLAHAVCGFFHNGGTRCFVVRMEKPTQIKDALEKLQAIDEIAIVAAPGITDDAVRSEIIAHCEEHTQDRFAIFDSPEEVSTVEIGKMNVPKDCSYAAFYFPWIQVFDPATKTTEPRGDGRIFVPPSGHTAGIYARVDSERGVHKAPANEPVLGALGLKYRISKGQQDGLNPFGANCIRDLTGNIRVWDARTIGGDRNLEWKYINVRRLFLFLKESIDKGTQWVVFEPNNSSLWARIIRIVSAFLTDVWRDGALFGNTPQQAFYVKCDEETNPPEVRDLGCVVTEIGVAIVRPGEFVIFHISQWAGPKGK